MENTTTPTASAIPAGFWLASDLADRRIEYGYKGEVLADGYRQEHIGWVFEEMAQAESAGDDLLEYPDPYLDGR